MVRPHLPLNALRAFEASARHLSFTRAAIELSVTQAAVSHQVKVLEQRLNIRLFKRLPRGLMVTEEAEMLLPVVEESFDRIADMLERFEAGQLRDVLNIGAVGTFAVGWLLPRLPNFQEKHPFVDVRLSTNNNRVDIAAEGLDYAIRFGNGAWHDTDVVQLFQAPLTALCLPDLAESIQEPKDVLNHTMLRSYRTDEWTSWFKAAGVEETLPAAKGVMFDSSLAMMEAVQQGAGIALAPPLMFARQLSAGLIAQPFEIYTSRGSYWLTRLKSKTETPAMRVFREWITGFAARPS